MLIHRLVGAAFRIAQPFTRPLLQSLTRQFAIMTLFERPKQPWEIDPSFRVIRHRPGANKNPQAKRIVSHKLNKKTREQKYKVKNMSSMLNRVKIVGPIWNRQFKFKPTEKYHLMRNKTSQNKRRKNSLKLISKADLWRVRKMIPYFKRQALKRAN